jgi:hypothetical protein
VNGIVIVRISPPADYLDSWSFGACVDETFPRFGNRVLGLILGFEFLFIGLKKQLVLQSFGLSAACHSYSRMDNSFLASISGIRI